MKLFISLIPLFFLVIQIHGQGRGNGISKRTWAASDPVQCFNWLTTYLPVAEEFDACPNHQCTCAVQGRVHTTLANNGVGFGIHSIQCTQHPYGDISVKEMEDRLQAKYGDFSKYDAFMDDNMAFWANNLDNYAHAFQRDGIPFMTLKWTWESNQYYSLLANPCGFILIELMSNHLSAVPEEDMIQSHTRMTWRNYNTNIIPGHHITPIRVSRAISRPELVDLFWIDILNSQEIYSETFDDGTTVREIIPPGSTVHIQFWSGHPTSDEFTVADFEDYINSVHNDVMISGVCGFDQWIDNHIAIDAFTGPTLAELAQIFETYNFRYHWWQIPGGIYQIYVADESGYGIQLDFPGGNPVPPNVPTYSAACASDDGCLGQGNCKADFYRRVFNI